MRYAMLVKPHANVRYRQSLQKLSLLELECILDAWDIDGKPRLECIQGEPFLVFDTERMSDDAWRALSRHSAICFAAEFHDGALLPLRRDAAPYLPDDLSQVLKYKGKTNADFTQMMLNCARAASAFAKEKGPLRVLDPLCGKGTTLFCALQGGDNAVGVEMNAKAIAETDAYFGRFLKLHKCKHKRETGSQTMKGGGTARRIIYTLADTAEHMKADDTRTICLLCGDAVRLGELVRPGSCQLIACDLPYGVQHAPKEGRGGMSSLKRLADALSFGCASSLCSGGALALAFNLKTLHKADVVEALEAAGLWVMKEGSYADFSHWVEQAVDRDMVVARKK